MFKFRIFYLEFHFRLDSTTSIRVKFTPFVASSTVYVFSGSVPEVTLSGGGNSPIIASHSSWFNRHPFSFSSYWKNWGILQKYLNLEMFSFFWIKMPINRQKTLLYAKTLIYGASHVQYIATSTQKCQKKILFCIKKVFNFFVFKLFH